MKLLHIGGIAALLVATGATPTSAAPKTQGHEGAQAYEAARAPGETQGHEGAQAYEAARAPGETQGHERGRPYTVTLITGDRVTVDGPGATTASVARGPGRSKVTFAISSGGGHLRVIPSDAASLIRTDRVDARLFDVTELITLGYDDARRTSVPLIVSGTTTAVTGAGARRTRDLAAVRGSAVTAPKSRAGRVWTALRTDGVRHVWLDGMLHPALDQSVPQIGAPAAWQAGYQGQGMSVAVLDGGVDATHPDLAGRVTSVNFTDEADGDLLGHGTHVASTIAGDGTASGGKYRGVAPKATILSGKVCELIGCPESAILAGMQWAAVDEHAKVINMSLGGDDYSGTDPLEDAVNTLTAQTGSLFVIAAGNEGPSQGTIASPGNAAAALTVGAVDTSNELADFSSRGPRDEDEAIKPDITAPGVDIVAARAAGTELGEPAADFPDSYVSLSGTSMATPHVSGSAILLAQEHPDWTADRLKATLMSSAAPQAGQDAFQQGAGRVDVAHAITQAVTTSPTSVSFGLQTWPHTADRPLSKTVTYRNDGTSALNLTLSLPGDAAEVYSLSATTLAVPSGGTASVTVTANTLGDVPVGTHTAELTAIDGTTSVVTPLGIDKEPERYALTLKNIALDGSGPPNYLDQIWQPDGGDYFDLPYDPSGTVTLRVPPGRYSIGSYLDPSPAGDGEQSVMMFQPVIDIGGDTTVTFDARQATPVSQSVPQANAVPIETWLSSTVRIGGSAISYGLVASDFGGLRYGRLGGPIPGETSYTGGVTSTWAAAGSGDGGYDSPYVYQLSRIVPGQTLQDGYHESFAAADLTATRQVTHADADGMRGFQWWEPISSDGSFLGAGNVQMHAPGSRVVYLSRDPGVTWRPETAIGTDPDQMGVLGTYYLGSGAAPVENWGRAPFGTQLGSSGSYFSRDGASMSVTVPADGDADGHPGLDYTRTVSTSLYAGQTLVDQEDGFGAYGSDLPDSSTTYRVVQSSTGDTGGLATRIDVAMTFASASTDSDISVITVRATPHLGAHSSVAAGRPGTIPLTVLDQAGHRVGSVRSLTASVSYDDGKTWRRVPVSDGVAHVAYPSGHGFVSLRLHAAATAGRAFDQTVIRAYRYGG